MCSDFKHLTKKNLFESHATHAPTCCNCASTIALTHSNALDRVNRLLEHVGAYDANKPIDSLIEVSIMKLFFLKMKSKK